MTFANVHLDGYKVWAYLTAGWMDVTSYAVSEIAGDWGNQSPDPLDMVAATGTFSVTLNNTDQKFSPGYAGALAGWKKGIKIKLVLTYDGEDYVR